jgi:medium-chain acyl-[acyl-carrier-protein] hydrolase
MTLMIPLLRADFEICETYRSPREARLDCPITAFGGLADTEVPRGKIEGWREHTSGHFSLYMLPGDHFFVHTSQPDIVRIVVRESSRPATNDQSASSGDLAHSSSEMINPNS